MFPELTDTALVFGDEVTTFADLLLLGIATGLAEEAMGSTRRGLWALEQAGFKLSGDVFGAGTAGPLVTPRRK